MRRARLEHIVQLCQDEFRLFPESSELWFPSPFMASFVQSLFLETLHMMNDGIAFRTVMLSLTQIVVV